MKKLTLLFIIAITVISCKSKAQEADTMICYTPVEFEQIKAKLDSVDFYKSQAKFYKDVYNEISPYNKGYDVYIKSTNLNKTDYLFTQKDSVSNLTYEFNNGQKLKVSQQGKTVNIFYYKNSPEGHLVIPINLDLYK